MLNNTTLTLLLILDDRFLTTIIFLFTRIPRPPEGLPILSCCSAGVKNKLKSGAQEARN